MRRNTGGGERRARSTIDLEEVRPHIFRIHDPRLKSTLKGEGTINGQQFELTSWRREGLMARLRERGFNVRTLADQVEALPNPPYASAIGAEATRPLATATERFSYFDPLALTWVPTEVREQDGQKVVVLREGWSVRRRKGRGAADYYTVFIERPGGAGLRAIDETRALMMGYSQATTPHQREIVAHRVEKHYLLPDMVLPEAYRKVLSRIGERTADGWRVHERGWPLSQEIFARLGLLLRAIEARPEPTPQRASRPAKPTRPAKQRR